jgi:hypothetical protein
VSAASSTRLVQIHDNCQSGIALRVPYKRLLWDAQQMSFTNSPDANTYVRRKQYREGWDAIIG